MKANDSVTDVRIFCEGKSDYSHLDAALKSFHARGQFRELRLDLQRHVDRGGDKLLEHCRTLALTPAPLPTVFVFDSDVAEIVKKADGEGGPKGWGNGVFSLVIPVPPFRTPGERLCIELLYPDDDLRRVDPAGRRIYLRSEFEDGKHKSEPVYCPDFAKNTLVVSQALDWGSRENRALTKVDFARHILLAQGAFSGITFEGFRGVFEYLMSARERWLTGNL